MDQEYEKTLHVLKLVVVTMMCFVVILFVFGVGIFVGQVRAEFSFRWAQDYHKNFGGPQMGIFSNFPNRDFANAHGVFGQVLKIDGSNIIVKGQSYMETTVVVFGQTSLVNNSTKITLQDIKVGDNIVVVGSPNKQGQIEAQFIRIFP